jgi:hypothetical protein
MFPVIKVSLEEVLCTRFLLPSSGACPACPERSRGERSRRAPAWGRRIAKFLSPEGVLGTRFLSPSPVACPACPERSRGERSRRAPAWGRRITKSLSPEEVLSTRFFLRVD